MGQNTSISWTDYTFSPWWGCTPVSPGCANCYAAAIAKRFRGLEYRKGAARQLTKDWEQPKRWNRKAAKLGKRFKVFPSMCDPFDEEVPQIWLDRLLFGAIETPNLDWLLLTKRPEQIAYRTLKAGFNNFPTNVWLGVSVENQEQADKRIPLLLSIPARVRFLSVEPLLGPVNLTPFVNRKIHSIRCEKCLGPGMNGGEACKCQWVDWVIVGGESGPNRRDCGIEPLLSVVQQCTNAGVPVFVKQDCALKPGQQGRIPDDIWARKEFPI